MKKSITQKSVTLQRLKAAFNDADRHMNRIPPAVLDQLSADTRAALSQLQQAHIALICSLDRQARPELYR